MTPGGPVLDIVLGLSLAGFVTHGLVSGLLRIVGGVVGFVLGGVVGLRYGPDLVDLVAPGLEGTGLLITLVAVAVATASLGQAVGSGLVRRVRTAGAVGFVDRAAGAVVALLFAATALWIGAGLLRLAVPGSLGRTLDESRVVRVLDGLAPVPREQVLDEVTRIAAGYAFPRVVEPGSVEPLPPAEAADSRVTDSPTVTAASRAVVRIEAVAPGCERVQEGTGFVVRPGWVVTNAHVVAGSETVDVVWEGHRRVARVVAFDPDRDLAVLAADTAGVAVLPQSARPVPHGSDAVIAGYPLGGPYRVVPARVGDLLTARGRDIHGVRPVERRVYVLRSAIHPGNSGGPLLTKDGEVAGVVFARSADTDDTAYALHLDELTPVLASAAAGRTTPVGGCVSEPGTSTTSTHDSAPHPGGARR